MLDPCRGEGKRDREARECFRSLGLKDPPEESAHVSKDTGRAFLGVARKEKWL